MPKFRLQVVHGHRYQEVSLRTLSNVKLWISQEGETVVDTKDLRPGEEWVIRRYEDEGKLIVKAWRARKSATPPEPAPEPEPELEPEPEPVPDPQE